MPTRALFQRLFEAGKLPQWRRALLTALVSDGVSIALVAAPPAYWVVDGVTIVILFMLLGVRWPLLPALLVEAVPGLQVFPTWTLVVLALAATQERGPPSKTESPGPRSGASPRGELL